ncbi:zinc metallopeptidase [Sandaracinobacter sp. RS1-74]|uniref:KPN_02809 family neutral zinc metallopeptidase n=1 Tax=Sandaracinobacteroides sayramensis TaxID=2913411 RepID=UPI001EDA8C5A|nr:neutral zinc metallopeptidase [Sandaracinobacteroides sayramensis]MCG2839449.1 zinc metallopeptidase [Sandaracinobacteroides sayramensis]
MRLDDQRESSNIENRRGEGGFGWGGGGQQAGGMGGGLGSLLGIFLPLIGSRFGIVGIVVVIGAVLLFNCMGSMQTAAPPTPQVTAESAGAPGTASPGQIQNSTDSFVAKVLATTEDSWGKIFAASGQRYPAPKLVLFDGSIRSACGGASAASGPFYCPADQKVYLDTAFFTQLSRQFGAPGDFAAAYVIAHEVGHHVQTVTGTSQKVAQAQQRAGKTESNQLSVRLELQADCYAGVWAAHNRNLLDSGDFAEGVRAAQAIGDDTLQHQMQGRVVPDSFTHGSADQRIRWLTKGFESGDPNICDTFSQPFAQL